MSVNKSDYTTRDVVSILENGVYRIISDHYWWCIDGDPKQAIIYKGYSPQCNSDKRMVERINYCLEFFPTAEIVKIEIAFMPEDMREYG